MLHFILDTIIVWIIRLCHNIVLFLICGGLKLLNFLFYLLFALQIFPLFISLAVLFLIQIQFFHLFHLQMLFLRSFRTKQPIQKKYFHFTKIHPQYYYYYQPRPWNHHHHYSFYLNLSHLSYLLIKHHRFYSLMPNIKANSLPLISLALLSPTIFSIQYSLLFKYYLRTFSCH